MRKKRFMISLGAETEDMVKRIQEIMAAQMPKHLPAVKISKCLAVETAIKKYVEQLENLDEQF